VTAPYATYDLQTVAANTGGTVTTATFGDIGTGGKTPPAKTAYVSIFNPTASTKAVASATLTFTEVVGGVTLTLTYNLTIAPAAGAAAMVKADLTTTPGGILRTPKVNVTFASAPAACSVGVLLQLMP